MINSLDHLTCMLATSFDKELAEVRKNPHSPEGAFISYCDMLGEYCFGYAAEVVSSIVDKDPEAIKFGTPSFIAMRATVKDMVFNLVAEQSRVLASQKSVKDGAVAFWNSKVLKKRKGERVEAGELDIAKVMADLSMSKFTELSADATPGQSTRAKITYMLLAKPLHGNA